MVKEIAMYSQDLNINTALERQVSHVHAVRLADAQLEPAARRTSPLVRPMGLALAAAPVLLAVAWGLFAR
jgi:hypothetical protein